MSQSQGTSHPSRWKLEWIWFPITFFSWGKRKISTIMCLKCFQYLNVISTMPESQGTSHPSRWKLQCPQYDFPYEKEYSGKSQWLCPSSIFPLELLHLQDKPCGQTVTYLISLHVSGQGLYLMVILMNVLMVMVVTGDWLLSLEPWWRWCWQGKQVKDLWFNIDFASLRFKSFLSLHLVTLSSGCLGRKQWWWLRSRRWPEQRAKEIFVLEIRHARAIRQCLDNDVCEDDEDDEDEDGDD